MYSYGTLVLIASLLNLQVLKYFIHLRDSPSIPVHVCIAICQKNIAIYRGSPAYMWPPLSTAQLATVCINTSLSGTMVCSCAVVSVAWALPGCLQAITQLDWDKFSYIRQYMYIYVLACFDVSC